VYAGSFVVGTSMEQYLLQSLDRKSLGSLKWMRARQDELPLWVADMDFPPPPAVLEALDRRIKDPYFPYSLAKATIEAAYTAWCKKRQAWDPSLGSMQVCGGVLLAVNAAVLALSDVKDAVVVQTPVYPPLMSIPKTLGRELLVNPLIKEADSKMYRYRMDYEALEQLFRTKHPRLFILCSPHNPVGRVWTEAELEELLDLCEKYEVALVSDEIHADVIAPGVQFTSLGALLQKRQDFPGVLIQAPSKTFNIPGLGSGIIWTAKASLRDKLSDVISGLGMSSVGALNLCAVEAAYTSGEAWLEAVLRLINQNMQSLETWLKNKELLEFAPREGSFLAWIRTQALQDALNLQNEAFQSWLRNTSRVLLSPGYQFGEDGWVRLNLACNPALLKEALQRLELALQS